MSTGPEIQRRYAEVVKKDGERRARDLRIAEAVKDACFRELVENFPIGHAYREISRRVDCAAIIASIDAAGEGET